MLSVIRVFDHLFSMFIRLCMTIYNINSSCWLLGGVPYLHVALITGRNSQCPYVKLCRLQSRVLSSHADDRVLTGLIHHTWTSYTTVMIIMKQWTKSLYRAQSLITYSRLAQYEILRFYGTQRFITVVTRAHNWTSYWVRRIQSG
jgi:hypothetical protein